jgi:AAA ATPase domain
MAAMGDPEGRAPRRVFVGRDREAAELVAGLEDAADGQGRLFLIAGEPGIGKTWMAEHLAGRATDRGFRVVWGRCWEGGGAPPFWPWAQMISALAEDRDDQTLSTWLGTGAAHVAQMVPVLAQRLGTPVPAAASLESEATRFLMFEATARFLRHAASAQPLLLALDDLHAADGPSLLLLQFVSRQLRGARLLVVGTYRDVEAGQHPAVGDSVGQLVREGRLISLGGLARQEVGGLIEALSGEAPSEARVAAVYEATEGNPLFVREAVRLLATEAANGRPGSVGVPIPGSVRAVIQRRLAPLSADAVGVLSVAAVVGREFDLALLALACGLSADRVLDALSEASALGVVAGEEGAIGRYRFTHSLMREVLYEQLPIPARLQLHRQVGEAIEEVYGTGSTAPVAELARHFAEVATAGEAAKALGYARRAGDRAMEMYAYEQAAAEYQLALRALKWAGGDEAVACEMLLRLGAALARAGDYRQAEESCLRAAEIARKLGASEQLARAALGYGERQVEGGQVNRQLVALLREALDGLGPQDSPLRARLLGRLSLELTFSEETDRIEALSREAIAMARRLADPAALRTALDTRWMAVWGPDGLEERTALSEEILQRAREIGDREMELDGYASRAACSLESGDPRAALADIAAHARLVEELPLAIHRWAATTMRAMGALLRGAFDEGQRLAEEALSLQPGRPNVMFTHLVEVALARWEQGRLAELSGPLQSVVDRYPRADFAIAWLSLAHAEVGDDDAARAGLRSMIELLPQRPRNGIWLPAAALTSVLAAHLNEPEAAALLYPMLEPYEAHIVAFTAPQPLACHGSVSLYLALLATVIAQWDEAADQYEAAIRAHERLGAVSFLARTRYEYARMLVGRGVQEDRTRAVELLDRAAAATGTVGMAAVAQGIETLRGASEGGVDSGGTAGTAVAPEESRNVFRREGDYWTVSYDGVVVRLRDVKGLRHLARLLTHPAREFHAADLEAADGGAPSPGPRGWGEAGELALRPDLGDAGELLDATAKAAYKARLDELRAELDEAEGFNDQARAATARAELDFLVGELARAVGLGGRDRRAASHAERARLNATRAIRAAMAKLARANPALGRHLSATIRTGRYCSYTPDPRAPIVWER